MINSAVETNGLLKEKSNNNLDVSVGDDLNNINNSKLNGNNNTLNILND